MVSITIPEKMSEEIDAIIDSGYYDNRSELIREAIRMFLAKKAEVRLVAAVELYRKGKVTISRAAELAGVPFDQMKSILRDERVLTLGKKEKKRNVRGLEEMVV